MVATEQYILMVGGPLIACAALLAGQHGEASWSNPTLQHEDVIRAVQLKGLQEENKSLRQDNATLAGEVEQMNRVASYVGSRVAKVLAGARRANNYNAALVGELKRWNRKLEVGRCLTHRARVS